MGDENRQDDAYRNWLLALGRRLAHHRRQLGLTQAAAAERCGMDLKHYQDAEYGRRALGTRALFTISTRLGAQLAKLVDGDLPEEDDQRGISQLAPDLAALGWQLFPRKPRSRRNTAPAIGLTEFDQLAAGVTTPRFWGRPPDRSVLPQGSFLLDLLSATNNYWSGWALCQPGRPASLLGAWLICHAKVNRTHAESALARVVALSHREEEVQVTLRSAAPDAEEWQLVVPKLEALEVSAHVADFLARSLTASSVHDESKQSAGGSGSVVNQFDRLV